MTEEIKEIFEINRQIIDKTDCIIRYLRGENFHFAMKKSSDMINLISGILNKIVGNIEYFNLKSVFFEAEGILNMLQEILSAQENKDYVFLADLLEIRLRPFIIQMQEAIITNEQLGMDNYIYEMNLSAIKAEHKFLYNNVVDICGVDNEIPTEYSLEYTSSGMFTLSVINEDKGLYLHSNNNPMEESVILCDQWYDRDIDEYGIYGLGLGYHLRAIAEKDETAKITVFESDINIIKLFLMTNEAYWLLKQKRIQIYYDREFKNLNEWIKNKNENKKLFIHYPSLMLIKDSKVYEWLNDYFIQYSSMKSQSERLNANFRANITNYDAPVDELKEVFKGKTSYIIAAGPSLDMNCQHLKNVKNGIIFCVGTVYKKLIKNGIKPDYVIITDGNNEVLKQIEGVEDKDIPIMIMSSAFYGIGENYKGRKYIICQRGYDRAEKLARERGYNLYDTGGSVSTTALDICIQFECNKIVFAGLDLAYTDNRDHASGTAAEKAINALNNKKVKDINGNEIYTINNLDIYRKWIEKRITKEDCKNIEIIDATEGGAKLEGMRIEKLESCIE